MRHISLNRVSTRIFATTLLLMVSLSASAQYYLNVYEKSGSNNQYEIANLDSVSISDVKEIDNTPILTRLVINKSEVNLETGDITSLSVKGYDANGVEMTLDNLQWKSNNYSVASVDENGVVRTYRSGAASIIASIGVISDTCVILVKDHVYTLSEVVKLSLDKVGLNVETGVGDSLSVKGYAVDGTEIPLEGITWISNNTSVATVNENGVVATNKSGNALIIASLGAISDTCRVTVVDHVYTFDDVVKIIIEKDTLFLETGLCDTLNVIGIAFDGVVVSLDNVYWKSSDYTIATIDEKGVINAMSSGLVSIVAFANKLSDTCVISIVEPYVEPKYKYVDLGLSVEWATFNVGASSPYDIGNSYAFGESETKSKYDIETYKYYNPPVAGYTKYNFYSNVGPVDYKYRLDMDDDVVRKTWGDDWRIPTKEEIKELVDSCLWEWLETDSVSGYKVIGPNGNYIFLPFGAYKSSYNYIFNNTLALYLSSSLDLDEMGRSFSLGFDRTGYEIKPYSRYFGELIRPVHSSEVPMNVNVINHFSLREQSIVMTIGTEHKLLFNMDSSVIVMPIITYSDDDCADCEYDDSLIIIKAIIPGTFTVTANLGAFTSSCNVTIVEPKVVSEGVDLGLSVKWATCNLGAETPYQNGYYYTWGDTELRNNFTWINYKWFNSLSWSYSKYSESDSKTVLDEEDDAAKQLWGGEWRIPTPAEFNELIRNCNWEWISENGITGYKVSSKVDPDKYIFLRAGGTRSGISIINNDSIGHYWTSSLGKDISHVKTLFISSELKTITDTVRYYGLTIRPVIHYSISDVSILSLSKDTIELEVGADDSLTVRGFATSGVEIPLSGINWKSDNPTVASVNERGVINTRLRGVAHITASVGKVSITCTINVVEKKQVVGGLYMGVMGFSRNLYTQPISLLNNTSKKNLDNFIDGMNAYIDNQTILCYAVDNALQSIHDIPVPENLSTISIVTFTDGRDKGSLGKVGYSYESVKDYRTTLKNRISTDSIAGVRITAYSIGLQGDDVEDDQLADFDSTLMDLASDDSLAIRVENIDSVNVRFEEIASKLNTFINYQTVPIAIPTTDIGVPVRFTFDLIGQMGDNDKMVYPEATSSSLYIEGVFDVERSAGQLRYYLKNLNYCGIDTLSGRMVEGVELPNGDIQFTFAKVLTKNNTILSKSKILHWEKPGKSWERNSEFNPDQQDDIELIKSSAVIMLVLDCSSSLGNDFETLRTHAKSFINKLYESYGNSSNGGENNGGNGNGNGNGNVNNLPYSKEPVDLSLAVTIDGQRYYLTQAEYKTANLSNAIIEGLTVVFGGESFIIALQNEPINNLTQSYAISYYGSSMATKTQGEVISTRWSYINSALSAFGGSQLSNNFWSKYYTTSSSTRYSYYIYSGSGQISYTTSTSTTYPVRLVKSTAVSAPIIWRDQNDLKLVAYKNSERFHFTQNQWSKITDKDNYEVKGVLVTVGSNKFIVSLKNEPVDAIVQSSAITYYGNKLPTEGQGRIIYYRWDRINSAIQGFGGTTFSSTFWSGYTTTSGSTTYRYYINNSGVSYTTSNTSYPVRLVYPYENYEYVDLGLSVKWAKMNVGAEKPEQYGDYFGWGEKVTKDKYSYTDYTFTINGYSYSNVTFSKYNNNEIYGTVDNKTKLDISDDVARQKWGGSWRMPTKEEYEELINNCTWTWTTFNGVVGYKVTSKKAGYEDRFIFLPAAGGKNEINTVYVGSYGFYWSSTLNTDYPYSAWRLDSSLGGYNTGYIDRYSGLPIRPVCP